jgi:hypothetical protein
MDSGFLRRLPHSLGLPSVQWNVALHEALDARGVELSTKLDGKRQQ